MLIIGARGCGEDNGRSLLASSPGAFERAPKTGLQMIESVIRELVEKHGGDFHVVG